MTWLRVGQVGGYETSAIPTTPPRVQARQAKTGTPKAAIFFIEDENVPTDMETQQLRGESMDLEVLDEADRMPTKPTFEANDDKLTYEIRMIEYDALMNLHLFYMQLKKLDEKSKPKPATMTIPSNKTYATVDIKKTKNYYRVLAEDKPADADEESDDETTYVEPLSNNNTTTTKRETTAGAAARTTASASAWTTAAAAATTKDPALQTKRQTTARAAARTTAAAAANTKLR